MAYAFCDLKDANLWKEGFSKNGMATRECSTSEFGGIARLLKKEPKNDVLMVEYTYKNPWCKILDRDNAPPYILLVKESMVIPEFQYSWAKPQTYFERERRLFLNAKMIICYNEFMRDEIRYRYQLQGRAVVIPWGVADEDTKNSRTSTCVLNRKTFYYPTELRSFADKLSTIRSEIRDFKSYTNTTEVPSGSIVLLRTLSKTDNPSSIIELMKKGCLLIGNKTHDWLIKHDYDGLILEYDDIQAFQSKVINTLKEDGRAESFIERIRDKFLFQHSYQKNAERLDLFLNRGYTLQDRVRF